MTESQHNGIPEKNFFLNQNFFSSLIAYSRDVFTLLDSSAVIRYQSPSVQLILGYDPEELLGASLVEFIHPDDLDYLNKIFSDILEHPSLSVPVTFRFCRKDREWCILEGQLQNLLEDNNVQGILLSAQDITPRKHAEEARKRYEARFRTLAETASDAIVSINRESIILYANSATEKMFGFSHEELTGKNLSVIMPEYLRHLHQAGMDRYISTGKKHIPWSGVELPGLHKEGYEIPIEVSFGEFIENGEKIFTGIIRDISERKKTEEKTQHALEKERELNELKSRFVSIMSHEFRTPLSTILSSSELIEHYGDKWTKEKILKHLHRIQITVKNMTELLDDVLLIGKVEAGKLEFQPSSLNVAYYVSELVEEVRVGNKNRHNIILKTDMKSFRAVLDEKLLRYIIINLLSNAVKYSPEGSEILLDVSKDDDDIIFTVKDSGIGVPPGDLKLLFEAFHRASNIGTVEGTGLGLAIVKRAVDLHDGTIDVASELGKGTTFTVRLPFVEEIK